jgi:hypothetical protein
MNPHATSGSGACSTHATTIPIISGFSSVVAEFPTTSPSIFSLWKVHFGIQMVFKFFFIICV